MSFIVEAFQSKLLEYRISGVISDVLNNSAPVNATSVSAELRTVRSSAEAERGPSPSCTASGGESQPHRSPTSLQEPSSSPVVSSESVETGGDSTWIKECLVCAETNPDAFFKVLCRYLHHSRLPEKLYKTLELLEFLVQRLNHSFHLALARNREVQKRLLLLATRRSLSPEQRRTQRLARLTLLEYSRIFADDPSLAYLSTLAGLYESRTGRSLLRSLNVQQRHVCFVEPEPKDIIMISPRNGSIGSSEGRTIFYNSLGMPYTSLEDFFSTSWQKTTSGASEGSPPASGKSSMSVFPPTPPLPSVPHYGAGMTPGWDCKVCQQHNSPMSPRCSSCETAPIIAPSPEPAVICGESEKEESPKKVQEVDRSKEEGLRESLEEVEEAESPEKGEKDAPLHQQ